MEAETTMIVHLVPGLRRADLRWFMTELDTTYGLDSLWPDLPEPKGLTGAMDWISRARMVWVVGWCGLVLISEAGYFHVALIPVGTEEISGRGEAFRRIIDDCRNYGIEELRVTTGNIGVTRVCRLWGFAPDGDGEYVYRIGD